MEAWQEVQRIEGGPDEKNPYSLQFSVFRKKIGGVPCLICVCFPVLLSTIPRHL